jgi:UDP-glucose 4-epimerase
MKMKTLVTGGAGFIGSSLVALLLQRGHEVTVLDSLVSGHRDNLIHYPEVRFLSGDVRDLSILRTAAKGAEVIFHLAASVGNTRSIDHPRLDTEVNVLGTLNVLETARELGIRKVVFSSSAGIFGELKTLPIAEGHPAEPDSPYGASKLAAEKLCLAYAKLFPPFEAICLRYFNVFGVNQRFDAYGNVIPIFAHKLVTKQQICVFGDGEQTRDFIHVSDVARANLAAGENRGVSGAFNLGSGSRITINNLLQRMQMESGLHTEVVHAAQRPGDVRHSLADISAIRAALGFSPMADFNTALRQYLDWAKVVMK